MSTRRFVLGLLAVAAAGLAVRVAYVLALKRHDVLVGDEPYFHLQATWLAEGHGFTVRPGSGVPSALHPPLTSVVLAVASWLTPGNGILGQRLLLAVVGVLTVVAIGFLGREVAGARAGLVAGAIAACAPSLWVNDGILMSESLTALLVAVVVLLAYRARRAPSVGVALALGLACGLAALTRGELSLLGVAVALPALLLARAASTPRRWALVAVAAAAGLVVVGPWAAYNVARFEEPVLVSANLGGSLCGGNNDLAYSGSRIGLWVREGCPVPATRPADQSVLSDFWTRESLRYASDHAGRVPVVVGARLARLWGVYAPGQMVEFEEGEGRPPSVSWAAALAFPVLVVAAAWGLVVLGRRGVPRYPLLGVLAVVAVTGAAFFGIVRYRVPADVVVVVLAAAGVDGLVDARAAGRQLARASASSR